MGWQGQGWCSGDQPRHLGPNRLLERAEECCGKGGAEQDFDFKELFGDSQPMAVVLIHDARLSSLTMLMFQIFNI